MTERPHSAFDLRGWLRDRNRLHVDDFVNQTMEHINAYAERICEQCVSAETERCAAIAHSWQRADAMKLAAGEMTAQEVRTARAIAAGIERSIRALAERPAPPQPVQRSGPKGVNPCPRCTATWGQEYCKVRDCPANQQQDSARRIGVEQPTQQTGQPGCGMAETARSRAASIVGTWQDLHVHLYTDAALDDLELRIAHALSPAPSALASEHQAALEEARGDFAALMDEATAEIAALETRLARLREPTEQMIDAIAVEISEQVDLVPWATRDDAEKAHLREFGVAACAAIARIEETLK